MFVDAPEVLDAAVPAMVEGMIEVEAIWSHLADADTPGSASVPRQLER